MLLLERRVFLQLLYDALPDESCIRFNAEVVDIEEHVDEVRVKLRDGTVEKADMVLGCDGVHSLVRDLMWQHANQSNQGIITTKEKTCKRTLKDPLSPFCALNASRQPFQPAGPVSLVWVHPHQRWAAAQ